MKGILLIKHTFMSGYHLDNQCGWMWMDAESATSVWMDAERLERPVNCH